MRDYSTVDVAAMQWALEHNIREIVWYHNTVRGLLKRQYNDPSLASDEHLRDRLRRCDNANSASCLLVVFGFLEEMLFDLWKFAAPAVEVSAESGVLERYKPVLASLNLSVGSLPSWSRLTDANTVRNCLMHAHGRVSRMREPDLVRACVARNKATLVLEGDRLQVTPAFLGGFVSAVRQLRDHVLGV